MWHPGVDGGRNKDCPASPPPGSGSALNLPNGQLDLPCDCSNSASCWKDGLRILFLLVRRKLPGQSVQLHIPGPWHVCN